MNSICHWKENENGVWETGCGETLCLDGPLKNHRYQFCPYCGSEIDSEIYMSKEDLEEERGDRAYQEMADAELE